MAQKCVRKGCEKPFSDPDEDCTYHPGPPVFHEGQKGWKCCKPRVLTFEEFMAIPPCTAGKHSTTDLPPPVEKTQQQPDSTTSALAAKLDELVTSAPPPPPRAPVLPTATATLSSADPTAVAAVAESEDDDPALDIPGGKTCRRRGCGATYSRGKPRADDEQCVHHPGAPIFHEGSKGYSCCKRRVLEFDQFMKIEGCATRGRHLFVGSGKAKGGSGGAGEGKLETVRHDFYQTTTTVIASFFLKKIVADKSTVAFRPSEIALDLVTSDATPRRYAGTVPLFGPIDPAKSTHKILGTKLEVALAKAPAPNAGPDGGGVLLSWPVLRSDQATTGEIFQVGRAGPIQ